MILFGGFRATISRGHVEFRPRGRGLDLKRIEAIANSLQGGIAADSLLPAGAGFRILTFLLFRLLRRNDPAVTQRGLELL